MNTTVKRTIILSIAFASVLACTVRPSKSITCAKIMALRIGMSKDDVVAQLGAPVENTDKWFSYAAPDRGDGVGGIQLIAEFSDTVHLSRAYSFVNTIWDDLHRTIFDL